MIPALTDHLWQSTLFVLAAALVAAALRQNAAYIRHRIWLIASLKFLVPLSVLMSLGAALPRFASETTTPIVPPNLTLAVDRITQPFTSDVFLPTTPVISSAPSRTPVIIGGVWVSGFLVVVVMRLRGWRRVRAAMRSSASIAVTAPVPVRSSPGLLEPGVVGLWRPVLLVPAGIEAQLTPRQFEAVLLHEWCHVQRRDNLTSALHMVVEAVFWFHPLVWFVGARLVDERERACDEYVLRVGGDPAVYAESILNVCKMYVESPIACVSGVTGADLKQRIATILRNHVGLQLNPARKAALGALAILAVALPIAAGMLIAPVSAAKHADAASASAAEQDPAASAFAKATADKSARFDVVWIKPCAGLDQRPASGRGAAPSSSQTSPGYAYWDCVTLVELIEQAYASGDQPLLNVRPDTPAPGRARLMSGALNEESRRIRGGASWVRSDRFTIEVKASAETINPLPGQRNLRTLPAPMSQALRTMLEDRFQLKVHRNAEPQPMYALSVATGGLKIDRAASGSCIPWIPEMGRGAAAPWAVVDRPMCGGIYTGLPIEALARVLAGEDRQTIAAVPGPNRRTEFTAVTLPGVVRHLSSVMDHIVLDKATVEGEFTFAIEYEKDDRTPGGGSFLGHDWKLKPRPQTKPPSVGRGATIFNALEQLGLKLEPVTAPAEFIVIDRAERPGPNTPMPGRAR